MLDSQILLTMTSARCTFVFLFVFILFPSLTLAQDTLSRSYAIHAKIFDPEKREMNADMTVEVKNEGRTKIQELWFVTYPERFRKPLPNLDDLNYRRIYPDGFSLGSLELLHVQDRAGNKLSAAPLILEGIAEGTFQKVSLPSPLAPGQSEILTIQYRLTIPEKYGSFGYYRGVTTLSGGWYPYIASFDESEGFRTQDLPPQASFDVEFETKSEAVINGEDFRPSKGRILFRSSSSREISVQFAKKIYADTLVGRHQRVQIFFPKKKDSVSRQFRELVVQWLEFVEKRLPAELLPNRVALSQAPIRNSLAVPGEGVTFISDRAFKLLPVLGQYHSIPVLRSLFYQMLLPDVSRRESSRNYDWVCQVLSWYWTQHFLEEKKYDYLDARTLSPIRTLAFLPAVDEIIYTPQFAFVDAFFGSVYPFDPVRDDVLWFNHQRPHGRTIYAHLEDEVGPDVASKAARSYVSQKDADFENVAAYVVGRSLREKFVQWTKRRPLINYRIERHEKTKTKKGYDHAVTVTKEVVGDFIEPVELQALERSGQVHRMKWDGWGETHEFRFQTDKKLQVISLDPRGRLLETKRGDNRKPPKYKMVLTEILLDFDFNAVRPSAFVSSQLRRSYGGSNRYNFSASYNDDAYGVGIGYGRLFGRLVDRLRLHHGLGVGVNFQKLDDDFAVALESGSGASQVVKAGDSIRASSFSTTYAFGNQLSFTNPLEGGQAAISATWGTEGLGGEANYYRSSLGGSWIIPIHPSHLIAVRGFLGISGPSDLTSQLRYRLGGVNGIRGLSVNDDDQKGRYMVLTSAEYRHFLWQDLDWNLYFFRVRDVQGAFFADAGRTTGTVQERANDTAFGSSTETSFGDLFDVSSFETDVGYGIRLHVEYLGVDPALIRFDAAKGLSESGNDVRFYFGVTQSF